LKNYLILGVVTMSICACSQSIDLDVNIVPESFKILIPFEISRNGVVISTYWGKDKIENKLLWDNLSPTWVNDKVVSNLKSISKSKKIHYYGTTTDGADIRGPVYNCDSISVGRVTFVGVPFYKISGEMKGVFGDNMISKGVWEINLRKREMIFTSTVDSLKGDLNQAELFPAKFADDGIKIPVSFRNDKVDDVGLDFGYLGAILLPMSDFLEIEKGNANVVKSEHNFSTPNVKTMVEGIDALDTIKIKKNIFRTVIVTNKLVKAKLIGLDFFSQFEFVIFDYKNKLFYVSKKRRWE
jgi:hypothetical protein